MILIADSGSTKTEWRLIDPHTSIIKYCTTNGINPFYQEVNDIVADLRSQFSLPNDNISKIHFYGAGCSNRSKKDIVNKALNTYFTISQQAHIESDLLGATRALHGTNPGIACILGTGSNSCYYNGKSIEKNISPLGFIIGDEGSGAVLGKTLLADILKNQLPERVNQLFFSEYKLEPSDMLEHIYKRPFANRYLAQYTKFILKHIDIPEIQQLVITAFDAFIQRNLLQYDQIRDLKLSFIGSVAHYFQSELKIALERHHLQVHQIHQSPIEGLIKYHFPCR